MEKICVYCEGESTIFCNKKCGSKNLYMLYTREYTTHTSPPTIFEYKQKPISKKFMETKDYSKTLAPKTLAAMSKSFLEALNNGDLNKIVGGRSGSISVGEQFKLTGVEYIKDRWLPKQNEDAFGSDAAYNAYQEAFRKAVEEEDEVYLNENGVKRSWATFKTNRGDLSFTSVMGDEVSTAELWATVQTKAEDFNFDEVFKPSTRNVEDWAVSNFDGLLGKTIECVGVANKVPKGRFQINLRVWKVVG